MRRRDRGQENPRAYGESREKELLKRPGYKRTKNSGAGAQKGDFRLNGYMVEMKSTRHDSFRVDAGIMAKLKHDAMTDTVKRVLVVEIGTGERFAVLPLSTFERLVGDGD